MKRIYITCIINIVVIFMLAGLFSTDGSGTVSEYLSYAGFLSMLWSGLSLLMGLIFLAFRQKHWGQGFLLTAGILLLLGIVEFSFYNFVT